MSLQNTRRKASEDQTAAEGCTLGTAWTRWEDRRGADRWSGEALRLEIRLSGIL